MKKLLSIGLLIATNQLYAANDEPPAKRIKGQGDHSSRSQNPFLGLNVFQELEAYVAQNRSLQNRSLEEQIESFQRFKQFQNLVGYRADSRSSAQLPPAAPIAATTASLPAPANPLPFGQRVDLQFDPHQLTQGLAAAADNSVPSLHLGAPPAQAAAPYDPLQYLDLGAAQNLDLGAFDLGQQLPEQTLGAAAASADQPDSDDDSNGFECDNCETTFTSAYNLERHQFDARCVTDGGGSLTHYTTCYIDQEDFDALRTSKDVRVFTDELRESATQTAKNCRACALLQLGAKPGSIKKCKFKIPEDDLEAAKAHFRRHLKSANSKNLGDNTQAASAQALSGPTVLQITSSSDNRTQYLCSRCKKPFSTFKDAQDHIGRNTEKCRNH